MTRVTRPGSRTVRRSRSLAAALVAAALAIVGGAASCKQGEGQRCQIPSDCEEGLQCNIGEGVCRAVISGELDALPPPPLPDAPVDAPVDAAPVDAMIDAM